MVVGLLLPRLFNRSSRAYRHHIEAIKGAAASISSPTVLHSGRKGSIEPWGKGYVMKRAYSQSSRRLKLDDQDDRQCIESYKKTFTLPNVTHEMAKLTRDNIGSEVVIHGYLGSRVDISKKLSFVQLLSKDLQHSVQIVSFSRPGTSDEQIHLSLKGLNQHTPVVIKGKVKPKEPSKKADTAKMGEVEKIKDVEIELTEIHSLNSFPKDLMMTIDTNFTPDQRHLRMRTSTELRHALRFRADVAGVCRRELVNQGFVEIETPLLFKSTPEGAREFLVPTRQRGKAYALPQSPQQYKQILMASGIPKYFQLARCFRDEDLRADRQPEFTQLDLEMSFADGRTVIECVESLVRQLWKHVLNIPLPKVFPRMTYQEAMNKYGSDKPDLRIGMEILNIGELVPADLVSKISPLSLPTVEAIKVRLSDLPSTTREFVRDFMESTDATAFLENPDGQPGIFIYDESQPLGGLQPFGFQTAEYLEELLELQNGDLVVVQARKDEPHGGGFTQLGRLRSAIHKAAVGQGLLKPPQGFNFLWITSFPLFSPITEEEVGQGGAAGLCSTHHPFTAPATPEDVDLLVKDPASAKADHYDLVVNGMELGGGSRRIHNAEVQEYLLRSVLQMSEDRIEDFRHLLDVLKAGCPPHAGIALGFDRLVAVMLEKESVRDVIAFPKSGSGEDMLVKSPNLLTSQQLATYHLQLETGT